MTLYILLEWESPTPEIAFRRKEKQQLIGPAQILTTMELPHGYYDRMMVGISKYGLSIFSWNSSNDLDEGRLRYYTIQEGITLLCPCADDRMPMGENAQMVFFALTDHASAVEAKLTLELRYDDQTETIELATKRSEYGYFLFRLYRSQISDATRSHLELSLSNYYIDGQVIGHVTLFDRQGEEIASKTMDLTKP